MKDTCKQAILDLRKSTRVELICTRGDQPNRELRFFNTEDLLQLDTINVSSQATYSIETEFLPEFKGQLDHTNL